MSGSIQRTERRRAPRISVTFPVTLTWGRKRYRWQAREFSEFGVLLASTNKELVGEDVEIDLPLSAKGPSISLRGVVAYATGVGVGVRFKDMSPEHRIELKSYIQANSRKKDSQ